MNKTVIVVIAIALASAGWYTESSVPIGPVEVTVINPKYSTVEATEVAIREIEARGEPVNENNLRRALQLMSENDVRLPEKRSDLNKIIKDALQKHSRQKQVKAQKDIPVPDPNKFSTCKEYVSAYTAYRQATMSDYERDKWARKLGGMNEFKRENKKVAEKLWNSRTK